MKCREIAADFTLRFVALLHETASLMRRAVSAIYHRSLAPKVAELREWMEALYNDYPGGWM